MSISLEQATVVYPEGVELFNQGQMLEDVFLIVSGMIKLTQIDGRGRESLIGFSTRSDWLGSAAVIANQPASTTAATCSKTVLRRYPVSVFCQLLYEDRDLSKLVHEAHARELCRQSSWIGKLSSSDARARLVSVLLQFAANAVNPGDGAQIRIQLPIRQWELAEFIGITPEHLSRLFRALARDKVIARDKGWILMLAREQMEDHTEVNRRSPV